MRKCEGCGKIKEIWMWSRCYDCAAEYSMEMNHMKGWEWDDRDARANDWEWRGGW